MYREMHLRIANDNRGVLPVNNMLPMSEFKQAYDDVARILYE